MTEIKIIYHNQQYHRDYYLKNKESIREKQKSRLDLNRKILFSTRNPKRFFLDKSETPEQALQRKLNGLVHAKQLLTKFRTDITASLSSTEQDGGEA